MSEQLPLEVGNTGVQLVEPAAEQSSAVVYVPDIWSGTVKKIAP
jgi:hypothetical protein